MKLNLYKLVIPALITGLISACSEGDVGGGMAGIGGSGYVSSGQVTGFGSVYVNGVKFKTDTATFNVEDVDTSQQALRIGMIVQVAGSINADGISGTATEIRYGDNIQGQIEVEPGSKEIKHNQADTEQYFSVMGVNVIVDALKTTFEGTGFDYGHINLADSVEISGYYDNNGVLRATYIELKTRGQATEIIVEIEGVVSELTNTSFNVHGVFVDYSTALNVDLSFDLTNEAHVGVKGTYDIDSRTLFATQINSVNIELNDGIEVSVEGYITRYVSNSDFDINGSAVDASAAVLDPLNLIIRSGLRVSAKGIINNGRLNATEIVFDEGDAKLKAFIDSMDVANNQFTVEVVAGEPSIVVQLSDITIIEDATATTNMLTLAELSLGDFVEVGAYEIDKDTVSAILIRRMFPGNIKLQGIIRAQRENVSITVLDVEFPVRAATEFGDDDLAAMNHADFILKTTIDETVISIEDESSNGFGIADEVEIK